MVNLGDLGGGRGKPRQQPFAILADGSSAFTPAIYPERIQVTKERDLNRSKNYCKGEDVADNGTKNREVHINGRMTRASLDDLNEVIDSGEEYTLVSATWSGQVLMDSLEIEGPDGWWPQQNTMLWSYRIDAVSTGMDESEGNSGIISDGEEINPFDRRLYELAEQQRREEQERVEEAEAAGLVE